MDDINITQKDQDKIFSRIIDAVDSEVVIIPDEVESSDDFHRWIQSH